MHVSVSIIVHRVHAQNLAPKYTNNIFIFLNKFTKQNSFSAERETMWQLWKWINSNKNRWLFAVLCALCFVLCVFATVWCAQFSVSPLGLLSHILQCQFEERFEPVSPSNYKSVCTSSTQFMFCVSFIWGPHQNHLFGLLFPFKMYNMLNLCRLLTVYSTNYCCNFNIDDPPSLIHALMSHFSLITIIYCCCFKELVSFI